MRVPGGCSARNRLACKRARWPGTSRVDEEHMFGVIGSLGDFQRQLLGLDDANVGSRDLVGKTLGDVPSEAVVGTERIAISDDEESYHCADTFYLCMSGAVTLVSFLAIASMLSLDG